MILTAEDRSTGNKNVPAQLSHHSDKDFTGTEPGSPQREAGDKPRKLWRVSLNNLRVNHVNNGVNVTCAVSDSG